MKKVAIFNLLFAFCILHPPKGGPSLSLRFCNLQFAFCILHFASACRRTFAIAPAFLFSIFYFLFAICSSAQAPQSFNYQLIARDTSGLVLSNRSIGIQISILKDASNGAVVYSESHTATTNNYGLVNLSIGTGNVVSGDFSLITWGSNLHFLKLELDPAGGTSYFTMGTIQLVSVPYSLYAEKAGSISDTNLTSKWTQTGDNIYNNNSGNVGIGIDAPAGKLIVKGDSMALASEPLFEVKNKDGDPVFVVYPDSVRIIISQSANKATAQGGFAVSGRSSAKGSTGDYLVITPDSARIYLEESPDKATSQGGFAVSGRSSSKGGTTDYLNVSVNTNETITPSQPRILWFPTKEAFLTGRVLIESQDSVGTNSFASGFESKAIGDWSQALGFQSAARGDYSTAIGKNAVANFENSFAFGDGAKVLNSDAYSFGAGAIASGLGSFAFGSQGRDTLDNVTTFTSASGDYSFAMGLGSKATEKGDFAIGSNCMASGGNSIALGLGVTASGRYSFSTGINTTATGVGSISMGYNTEATEFGATAIGVAALARGQNSTAIGFNSAYGYGSLSMGYSSFADGKYSSAIGNYTYSKSYSSIAIGCYNIGSGSLDTWIDTDPLLELGNGSQSNPHNAVTVLKNGNTGIGTANPNSALEVAGTIHTTSGGIKFPDGTIQTSAPSFRVSVTGDTLYFNGGFIIIPGLSAANSQVFPVIKVENFQDISYSTVLIGSNVTSSGSATVTSRGVCWDSLPNPEITGTHTSDGTGIGIFTSSITGLTNGTIYHLRAYATNSNGTAYGNDTTFTTLAGIANDNCSDAMTLTQSSSCIPFTATTIGATESIEGINNGNADDDVWFKFIALSPNPTITVACVGQFDAVIDLRSGACDGSHIAMGDLNYAGGTENLNATGLTIGETYFIRVYDYETNPGMFYICVSGAGAGGSALPTVTTATATQITLTSAISGGTVTADGGGAVIERGLCWGVSPNPDINGTHTTNGPRLGVFVSNISGLNYGTTYHIRAYATNNNGTSYGGDSTFTTLSPPANDNCPGAIDLTENTSCNPVQGTTIDATESLPAIECVGYAGTADDDVWYKFTATTVSPVISVGGLDQFDAIVDLRTGGCDGTNIGCADDAVPYNGGTENLFATGLTIGETYFIRVYSYDSKPNSRGTFAICVFESPLTVTTTAVTSITQNSASSGGNVISDGGSPVTERGICWGASPDPGLGDTHTSDGAGLGIFTSNIAGLTGGTTYYVRAYAINNNDTAYRITRGFTTLFPTATNDNCADAITLVQNPSCSPTTASSTGCTESLPPLDCNGYSGNSDDDVWFKFVATSSNCNITVVGTGNFDAVVDLRSGACDGTNIDCADNQYTNGTETMSASGLSIGATYYIRVYHYDTGSTGSFTICVSQ